MATRQQVFGDGLHLELTPPAASETFNQFALMAAGHVACRWWPAMTCASCRPPISARMRRVCISTGRVLDDPSVRASTATSVYKSAEVRAVRRHPRSTLYAGRALQHRDAAGHLLRNYRCPTTRPWTRGSRRCRARAWKSAWRRIRWRRAAREEYFERLGSSSTPSSRWASRLLPDRGRLHPMGQEPGHSDRPRPRGAGSLVAWALKITDLDPLPYNLLFERFLNPERVSMPDFDIDFCMDRRDEVIDTSRASMGASASARSSPTAVVRQGGGARLRPRARFRTAWSTAFQVDPEHPGYPPEGCAGQGQGRPELGNGVAGTDPARDRTMSAT